MGLRLPDGDDLSSKSLNLNKGRLNTGAAASLQKKEAPLLSFSAADSDIGLKIQTAKSSEPAVTTLRTQAADTKDTSAQPQLRSVTSDGSKESEWMKNWINKHANVSKDSGAFWDIPGVTGKFGDKYVDDVDVTYINGTRKETETAPSGNTYTNSTVSITRKDGKGRPTQIRLTDNVSFSITNITYNKNGGQTEETTSYDNLSNDEIKEKYVYDKNGNLVSGKVVTTYGDSEVNSLMKRTGHYTVRTFKQGKWYVQEFGPDGKAVSKEITADEYNAKRYEMMEERFHEIEEESNAQKSKSNAQ